MRLKSWQGVPAIGEKSYYRDRIEWRNLERRLPAPFRFSGKIEPDECFRQYRGWDIHLDIWENPSAVRTLILCHGGGGNGRLVGFLAPTLMKAGYRVICPDLPGYGLTVRRRGKKISYNLWADIVADIARGEFQAGSGPLHFMGLSLGGLLAYGAAMRCGGEIAGGIIATTLLDTRRPSLFAKAARIPALGYISYAMRGLLDLFAGRLRIPMRCIAPMEKITNDPLISGLIASDPISGGTWAQLGFLLSLVSYDISTEPEDGDIPLLVAHPSLDPWTGPELSRPFFHRYGGVRQWVDLPGCGHLPIEEPGYSSLAEAIRAFSAQQY
ncbi:alpha/beta hydrolase [Salinispira pacifica]|uniref:Lysophospholipase n=1 Tax=Salinispira pacifica TaxID=1307761 RepID=V5WNQ0_9SPIO|nr:alpha/beta fold hydrolase [Salinispira pacifica]AHC16671.1 Lysophospholipase [Salinispira pacifica]